LGSLFLEKNGQLFWPIKCREIRKKPAFFSLFLLDSRRSVGQANNGQKEHSEQRTSLLIKT
jgi:hypothetical protein